MVNMETTETKISTTVSMSVPLLVPLAAPMIESTSQAVLVKWRRARKDYEQQVAMRLRNDMEKVTEAITSIKDSFTPGLLEVLCDVEWGIEIDKVTDAILTEKIDGVIATVANNTVPNVAAEFIIVKMNLKEADD
ncbi:unnamed protein product [Phytophthora fragariaefolia]|uniref:Unnamed protein product n=1 Tax=Phytophthora fragariaefolia TaxID=1490495 RepID=A0A9W6TJ26_9STRA|nr:unnamed protein product [Phytophthora fragariaefolia]